MALKSYWESIYTTKASTQVSWYAPHLRHSLQLIQYTGIDQTARIIDVGGGASTLVDDLLTQGFQNITVLDISAAALEVAKRRLGSRANAINWLEADIIQAVLPPNHYDLWHDRAVFHFLTQPENRQRYIAAVRHSLKPGGHIIVATFATDGPTKCSGLDVMRYNPQGLHDEFGDEFTLIESAQETHQTPFGTAQKFVYCYCRR